MPKAAAPPPNEWATVHDSYPPFDIEQLNRVVIEYASIDLHRAAQRERWPLPIRLVGKLIFGIGIASFIAPGIAIAVVATTRARGATSFGPDAELWTVSLCSVAGCLTALCLFVPWMLEPHRQWNRTMVPLSIMVAVQSFALLIVLIATAKDGFPGLPLLLPVLVCLAVSTGVAIGGFRFYHKTKPPAVDLRALSTEEIALLRKTRHRTLIQLRSRNIVACKDFAAYDASPLWAGDPLAEPTSATS